METRSEYILDAERLDKGELKHLAKASLETLFLYDFFTKKPFPLSEEGKIFAYKHIIPMKLENIRALRDYELKELFNKIIHLPFDIDNPTNTSAIKSSHVVLQKKELFKLMLSKEILAKDVLAKLRKYEKGALRTGLRNPVDNVTIDSLITKRDNFENTFSRYRSWITDGVNLRINTLGGKYKESMVYIQEKEKRAISLTNKLAKEAYKSKTYVGETFIASAKKNYEEIQLLKKKGKLKSMFPISQDFKIYTNLAKFVIARDKNKKVLFEKNPFAEEFTKKIKHLSFADVRKKNLVSNDEVNYIADTSLRNVSFDDYLGFMVVTMLGYDDIRGDVLNPNIVKLQEVLARDSRFDVLVKENSYLSKSAKHIRAIHLAVQPSETFVYDLGKEFSTILPHPRHFSEDDLSSLSFSVHLQGLLDKYDAEFGPKAHDIFKAHSDPFRNLCRNERRIMDKYYFNPLSSIVLKTLH